MTTDRPRTALDAHEEYRAAGYETIPIRLDRITDDRGETKKRPRFPGGSWKEARKVATSSGRLWQAVSEGYTDVALVCGPVAALDFDAREGESEEEVRDRAREAVRRWGLQDSVVEATARGVHVLTRAPKENGKPWRKRALGPPSLVDEVQVGEGALLFVAPSFHPVAERPYERLTPLRPVAELPECPLELLEEPEPERQETKGSRPPHHPREGGKGRGLWSSLDVVGMFRAEGMYRQELGGGKHGVRCPWEGEHTTGSDGTDTVVWEAEGATGPGFRCLHAHCEGRDIRDVREFFGPETVDRWCREEWRPQRATMRSDPVPPGVDPKTGEVLAGEGRAGPPEAPPATLADVWTADLTGYLDPDPFLIRPADAGLGLDLDRIMGGGLTPGQTAAFVAAGAGQGKTTFLHQWADGVAVVSAEAHVRALEHGETPVVVPVLFVSEMTIRDLSLRSLARQAGVEGYLLRDPRGPAGCRPLARDATYGSDALARARAAAETFQDAARFLTVVDRRTRVGVEDLREAVGRIRTYWEDQGCEVPCVLVVVDPIHRLLDPTRPEVEALGATLPALMDLAQRTDAVVLFTSDTTKAAVYGRAETVGKQSGEELADAVEVAFRGSYQLLHLPDVALGLVSLPGHSEALPPEQSARLAAEPNGTKYAEVIDAKSRWADKGLRAAYWYDPALFRFRPTSARELEGERSLADRIVAYVHANPGCSVNSLRQDVKGKTDTIRETVQGLIRGGRIVDDGDVTTGAKLRPPENPHGTGTGQVGVNLGVNGPRAGVDPGGSPYRGEPPLGSTSPLPEGEGQSGGVDGP